MTEPSHSQDADGTAALGICESLLLALTDAKIVTEKDARDLLTDVISSPPGCGRRICEPRQA
jgi:hypothetical protein